MKIVISNSIVLMDEWIKVKTTEEVIVGFSEPAITSTQDRDNDDISTSPTRLR